MTKKPESDPPGDENLSADQELGKGQDDQRTSGDSDGQQDLDVRELAASVTRLTEMVQAMQSDKDRGVQKALREAQDLRKQVEKIVGLTKQGMDATSIVAELGKVSVEDQLAALSTKVDQLLGQEAGGTANSPTAEQRRVITEIGLKEDDPAVTDAIRKGLKGDALKAELAMAALKQVNRPVPGASSAAPAGGGTSEEKDEFDVTDIEDADVLYKKAAEKEFGS